ncbi:MAG: O-antigen polymerase [Streptococcus sp.]|nr:O-antigen polymerase [Streptococcus sp.]
MIYLIISLITIMVIDFYFFKSFISPRILFLASFTGAMILMYLNRIQWDVNLIPKFYVYVISAIFSFIIGTFLIDTLSKFLKIEKNIIKLDKLNVMARPSSLLILISIICSITYMYLIVKEVGYNSNISQFLRAVYNKTVENNGTHGFLTNQMLEIVAASARISFFQIILDKYIVKLRYSHLMNYFNIILFLIVSVISTDRNIFIRFSLFCIVIWVLFYIESNKVGMRNINFKIIRKLILYFVIFLSVFYLLGKSKNYTSNFTRALGIYGGSGLYDFNLFLKQFRANELTYGRTTFKALLKTLSTLSGSEIGYNQKVFEKMIAFKSSVGYVYVSNIYSSLRPFVLDFGYLGMWLFPFFQGMFFEYIFTLTKRKLFGFSWIFYALMIYPTIYYAIDDQFFTRLHLGLVYEIFWVVIFYILVSIPVRFTFKH